MKLLAICLLFVGLAVASPHSERKRRDEEIFTAWDVQSLPIEERSAPGILQPLSEYDEFHGTQDAFAHSLDTLEEYGPPKLHDEYGVPKIPKIHNEYGPPALPTLKAVTEHSCPEEDFKQEFVPAPPSPPEIIPLPEIPIVKYESAVPEAVHEEYGIPEIVHPPAPLCPNGAPDVAYPFCCPNGATNPYCCVGEWVNPTCSEPKVVEGPYPEKVIEVVTEVLAPYPPKKLCFNGAEDTTYPFCCENGATNEFCCLGDWINPTCSEPTTTTSKPAPLCPNGAPDVAYPFCCPNGATNPYCCAGDWVNPTCSEPKVVEGPYPEKVIEVVTEVLAPYPPKKLCVNQAEDTTYPFCCENGATNEFCCLGDWINPTCSEPTTTTSKPAPLCPNGAPDVAYPFCCPNGATNPYCCAGDWVNPTCSEPKVIEGPYPEKVIEVVTEVLAPYPPKKLCFNGAEDTTYPFCCDNGATNEFCCLGDWINPTCSEPTTTPVPFVPKTRYAGKVYSKYEDSHVKNIIETGVVGGGVIETAGLTKIISSTGNDVVGQTIVGGSVDSGIIGTEESPKKIENTVRSTGGRKIVRPKVKSGGKAIKSRKGISGRRTHIIRRTPVQSVRSVKHVTGSRGVVRSQISGRIGH